MATEVALRNGTLEVGKTQELFRGVANPRAYPYDVTPDGQRFVVVRFSSERPNATPLTLVHNWTGLLKR